MCPPKGYIKVFGLALRCLYGTGTFATALKNSLAGFGMSEHYDMVTYCRRWSQPPWGPCVTRRDTAHARRTLPKP